MTYRAKFELVGSTAMIMHQFNIEGMELLKEWRQKPENKNKSVPGDDRTPPWTWQTYLYNDGEHVTVPHDNLMGALLHGGKQVTLKKQKTFKELSQSAIFIEQEHMLFTVRGKQVKMRDITAMMEDSFRNQMLKAVDLGFRLFAKSVVVNRKRHIRVRPRFDVWSCSGTLLVNSDDLPFETLQKIFELGGKGGLCDWRPSSPNRPGSYGQFTAKLELLK